MKWRMFGFLAAVLAASVIGYATWWVWTDAPAREEKLFPFIHANTQQANHGAFSTKDIRADQPEFRREYYAKLSTGRSMKITARSWSRGIMTDGELDQPGGKWVLFDPGAVADKIIDPELVPLVQGLCDEILAVDKAWRDSKPNQFTDETGTTWVRR